MLQYNKTFQIAMLVHALVLLEKIHRDAHNRFFNMINMYACWTICYYVK